LVFSVICATSLASCTQKVGSGDAPPPATAVGENAGPAAPAGQAESHATGKVIATLVTHDATVSILSRGGDLRVVIRRSDGVLVADGITIDELRTTDPGFHAIVTNAVASRSQGSGAPFIDATYVTHDRGGLPAQSEDRYGSRYH
jgi:hypothetical protein